MITAAQIKIDHTEIGLPMITASGSLFDQILGLVYTAIAAVALFFIVRGALLYVTSGSDPSENKKARETIIYAVIALAGATMVFPLIQFVVKSVGGS